MLSKISLEGQNTNFHETYAFERLVGTGPRLRRGILSGKEKKCWGDTPKPLPEGSTLWNPPPEYLGRVLPAAARQLLCFREGANVNPGHGRAEAAGDFGQDA